VKSYDDHDAAIAYINSRDRPLAFYPFDRDRARLQRTLDAVVAGGVCVNECLIQFGQHSLPVGGVGPSGMGEYHGHAGFLAFSKSMPVLYQSRLNGMGMLDPPFGKLADFMLKLLTR
jgi:coniferyl-aldehyde dehydrogenase